MSVNALGIVLIVIAVAFCALELVGLIRTIVKKRKDKQMQNDSSNQE